MRSNFAIGLATIGLTLGIAGASAAVIDSNMLAKNPDDLSSLSPPKGDFVSGLSAIKEHKGNGSTGSAILESLTTDSAISAGFARPNRDQPWRDGFAALTSEFGAVSKSPQQAMMPGGAGAQANSSGFAAIKAANRPHGKSDPALESALSGRAEAERSDFYRPPSK
jgi:hypothetical protein